MLSISTPDINFRMPLNFNIHILKAGIQGITFLIKYLPMHEDNQCHYSTSNFMFDQPVGFPGRVM